MEEVKKDQAQPEKMSYETLENVARQLSDQVVQLRAKVYEKTTEQAFKRLDYLFKILENKESFPKEFLESCIAELMTVMTLSEEDEEETKTEE